MFESEFYDKYFIAKLLPRYNKGQLKKKIFFKKDVKLTSLKQQCFIDFSKALLQSQLECLIKLSIASFFIKARCNWHAAINW